VVGSNLNDPQPLLVFSLFREQDGTWIRGIWFQLSVHDFAVWDLCGHSDDFAALMRRQFANDRSSIVETTAHDTIPPGGCHSRCGSFLLLSTI
jgi:hypothetical protein